MRYEETTEQIIKAFYKVYNRLGYGFLEKVYGNAMFTELSKTGFKVEKQKKILVYYDDTIIDDYCADMIVQDIVLCEFKANETLTLADEQQLLNYLKATNLEVGLLMNFGKKPETRRKIYDNDKKSWRLIRTFPLE